MSEIVEAIDAEIERLNAAKALLVGSEKRPFKRTMSRKARKAIAAAQKKRWAEQKKSQPTK